MFASSYGIVNGIHTSEDKRLLHDILRKVRLLVIFLIQLPCSRAEHRNGDTRVRATVLRRGYSRYFYFYFVGLITSDWGGTYSTSESIKAGLDLEMPYVSYSPTLPTPHLPTDRGPSIMRGSALQRALSADKVSESELDTCVRKVCDEHIEDECYT